MIDWLTRNKLVINQQTHHVISVKLCSRQGIISSLNVLTLAKSGNNSPKRF